MPRPTKLLPGQEVTVAAFNAEIDRTRKQVASVVGATIQSGATGGGLTPMREIKAVWGRLTKAGPDRSPDYYEWEEVYPDNEGNWTARTGDADVQKAPHDSELLEDNYGVEWLINPAVEANGNHTPIGSIVRLYPTVNFVEEEKALEDDRDDYWMHRHWLFSYDPGLRPFVLAADLIPARATAAADDTPIYDETIAAKWLDEPGADVTLYSAHQSGWPAGDSFISLGYGRAASMLCRGTQGWARFAPHGTRIGTGDDGQPEWRGEWQIVELYAELIQEMEVIGTNVILQGDIGQANLWWPTEPDGGVTDSGYDIVFFNDLHGDVAPDDFIQCRYDRYTHRWIAFGYPIPSGVTVYQSAGQATTSNYVVLSLDAEMVDGDGDDLQIGLHIERNGKTIQNTSERDIYGIASWHVCAQRDLDPPPDAPGPDAYCQCALFNNGNLVRGTESRLTSSRRRLPTPPETAAQMGPKAVNACSKAVLCKIKAGEAIDIRIRHQLSLNDPVGTDTFDTVPEHCDFTFVEIQGARHPDHL